MWGEDAGGPALPGAGDGEWAVQDPWRDEHRAADGGGVGQAGRRPHDERNLLGGQLGERPVRQDAGARKLRAYLPPEVAARLAAVPAELRAPVHPSQIPYLEIATKTPGSGGPDVPGRCAAGALPAPRGRAAELAAARAERAALAPWRAAIAAARLTKREALAARRAARMGKHDKDPMERLPGAGLGARAARIAAATEAGGAGGAGTAAGVVSARQGSGPGDGRTVQAGRGAAGGGHGIGEIVQRPCGSDPRDKRPGTRPTGARRGPGGAGAAGSALALDASRLDARIERQGACLGPSPAKSENGDKDPLAEPATGGPCPTRACHRACPGGALVPGIGPGGRTMRWPWGGLKGRLCATTTSSGLPPDVAKPGRWQGVLDAWQTRSPQPASRCYKPAMESSRNRPWGPP
jgi:hypothetical protein